MIIKIKKNNDGSYHIYKRWLIFWLQITEFGFMYEHTAKYWARKFFDKNKKNNVSLIEIESIYKVMKSSREE